ncbi:MAG: hypothetical protein H6619_02320 [Deltaproteobacteria bacterium]|nr:hypothetical protein [Deltaproteobacteria bacterium]
MGTTGLTRAVANLKEAQVIVTAQKPLAVTTLSLQNIDGLKPQESAKADENGVFKFESVPDGTWKIVGRGMKILDVKIIAR